MPYKEYEDIVRGPEDYSYHHKALEGRVPLAVVKDEKYTPPSMMRNALDGMRSVLTRFFSDRAAKRLAAEYKNAKPIQEPTEKILERHFP